MLNNELLLGLSLVALAFPFILSIFIAIQPRSRPKSVSDYFLYSKRISPKDFLKTSVGYSFQAASVVLFLLWSQSYGAIVIFIPIAWGVGYVLMMFAVKAGVLDDFLASSPESNETIHGYVGRDVQSFLQRPFVLTLAITTVAGIGGTLVAEVDYALSLILSVLGFSENPNATLISTVALVGVLFFSSCYVLWGGYRAVIETDKVQVPLSYISFCTIIFAVSGMAAANGHKVEAIVITIATVLLLLIFYLLRGRVAQDGEYSSRWQDRIVFWTLIVGGLFTLAFSLNGTQSTPATFSFFVHHENFLGFGVFGAISLILANMIWQFVDISSLQRLQSLEFPCQEGNERNIARKKISQGLLSTAVESCGVWILVIVLAFALKAAGVGEVFTDAAMFFHAASNLTIIITPLLVFALICFAISTIDGLISATAYVAYYDLQRPPRDEIASIQKLSTARSITFLTVSIICTAYLTLKWYLSHQDTSGLLLGQILYAIYAIQISIGPAVLVRLLAPSYLNAVAAITSIIAGWVGAFVSALTDPWLGIVEDSWYVIPPLVAFTMATAMYIFTYGIVKILVPRLPNRY